MRVIAQGCFSSLRRDAKATIWKTWLIMFTQVSIHSRSQKSSNLPLKNNEAQSILAALNQGKIYERTLPNAQGIKQLIENCYQDFWNQASSLTPLNCHAVSKLVVNKNSAFQRVTGYLIKRYLPIGARKNYQASVKSPPDFVVDPCTGDIDICLQHHSVISDANGQLFECLPKGWYKPEEFVFVKHQSGERGYFLVAR